jgi:hypothetical protein
MKKPHTDGLPAVFAFMAKTDEILGSFVAVAMTMTLVDYTGTRRAPTLLR